VVSTYCGTGVVGSTYSDTGVVGSTYCGTAVVGYTYCGTGVIEFQPFGFPLDVTLCQIRSLCGVLTCVCVCVCMVCVCVCVWCVCVWCVCVFYLVLKHCTLFTERECKELTSPELGSVSLVGRLFGDRATYSCDPGFHLVGLRERTCRADGTWSGQPPACRQNGKFYGHNWLLEQHFFMGADFLYLFGLA
jgi:hypothetical protein